MARRKSNLVYTEIKVEAQKGADKTQQERDAAFAAKSTAEQQGLAVQSTLFGYAMAGGYVGARSFGKEKFCVNYCAKNIGCFNYYTDTCPLYIRDKKTDPDAALCKREEAESERKNYLQRTKKIKRK